MFEASWEVCNKVGGIYTVVKSKSALMKEKHSNYFLIGPYFEEKARVELERKEVPDYLKPVFESLEKEGIRCHFGSWTIKSEPNVILLDTSGFAAHKDELKKTYWEEYKVDSISSGWDFEEPMIWSTAVGKLIEKAAFELNKRGKHKITGHFHEWLSGFGALYLKSRKVPVGTVFTTHATMLGRTLCAHGWSLYSSLEGLDPEKEAKEHGVADKFTTERACAHNADVFTTVSEITGIEAEAILGKKPDFLVLNGLDLEKFPTIEETSVKHNMNRDVIREFLSYYFYPYYTLDLEENLIYFIVGRYEYKNKGIDILTKALGKLNHILKEENSEKTVSVFYWIPGDAHGIKKEILENKTFYRHIRNYIARHTDEIQRSIIKDVLSQKKNFGDVFSKEFMQNNKKHMLGFKREGNPPLVTHDLGDEGNDAIIKGFKEAGLINRKEDKVKVILYPVYLNGVDGLIDMPYYDCIVASHLGIFPSYYEPWGYTPLESGALGVPAITTDLAGFGRFIEAKDERVNKTGMYVLKRFGKSEEEVVDDFVKKLYDYTMLNRHQRVANKVDAKELAELADWKELIDNYIMAHNQALEKKGL